MDERGIQEKCVNKRKRLDARTFREWHLTRGKKNPSPLIREAAAKRKDTLLYDCSDDLKASSLRQREGSSEACQPHSKQQRVDYEVNSRPSNEDAVLGQSGLGVPEVESGSNGTHKHVVESELTCRVLRPKKLSLSKLNSPSFIEFWVPVGFTHLQLEKYCKTLIKSSMFLCSSSENGILDRLHDALITITKCCDHPYLVDESLEESVNEGCQVDGYLSLGVEASGKLLLLEKLLQEAKRKQLRTLIVYKPIHSRSQLFCLWRILDDFIRQRFGEESYVHIHQEFDNTVRQTAIDVFNDKESEKFVLLMEKSSCQSSINISSLDFVILFNSDWRPINDLSSLQKMSIQSKFDRLKVLRLYSSNSVEEKVLIMANEGIVIDSSVLNFSLDICHRLLLWGASYLFKKLDDFHCGCSSIAGLNSLSEPEVELDVFHELSALLSCQESNKHSYSLISEIHEVTEGYSTKMSFCGEKNASSRDHGLPHYATWINILEGKHPHGNVQPESSHWMKRKESVDSLSHYSECESKNCLTMLREGLHSRSEASYVNTRLRKSCSRISERRASKATGNPSSHVDGVKFSPSKTHFSIDDIEEICGRRMQKLLTKQEKELCEFYRNQREKRVKLEQEHESKLNIISQRCGESAEKQVELKKLDNIFKEKIKEHNLRKDIKRKELQVVQHVSRIKEKQWKEKAVNLLMLKHSEEQVSSLVQSLSRDYDLGLETRDSVKNSIHSPHVIFDSVLPSKSQLSEGSETAMVDSSSQHGVPESPHDRLLSETVVLSLESEDEDDTASMPRLAVSNTVDCNVPTLVPENGASCSGTHFEKQLEDLQCTSNREIEGDGSTTMEPSEETLQGVTGVLPLELEGRSLESDGENDVSVMVSREHDTSTEPFNDASNLRSSEENHVFSGQKDLVPVPNLVDTEVQKEDCELEGSLGASSTEITDNGANMETLSTIAGHSNPDNLADLPACRIAKDRCVLEETSACLTYGISLPLEQVVTGKDVAQPHSDLGDHLNVLPMGSAPVSRSMESGSEHNLEEHLTPSSLPSRDVQHVGHHVEPVIGACNGEKEPRLSVNLPTSQVRQTARGVTLPNIQTIGNPTFRRRGQTRAHLGNLGSRDLSMVQPTAIMNSSLPMAINRDQPYIFNVGGTNFLRPACSYFQECSSLMSIQPPSSDFDPLYNELVRMQKEQEEAIKIHEDKVVHLRFVCDKEIEEVHKKYNLLLQETENAFLVKKEDLGSRYTKVYASKLLAEIFQHQFQKVVPSAMLQDAPRMPIFQHQMPEESNLSIAGPIIPPLQVVHRFSELISANQTRPQNSSALRPAGTPVGNQAQAQPMLFHPFPPIAPSLPMSGASTQLHGRQNQHILVPAQGSMPGLHHQGRPLGPGAQHDGSRENPFLL